VEAGNIDDAGNDEGGAGATARLVEYLRGLNLGGLNPANLDESMSPLSSFWEATIICSKMASVGERQALQVQEALPVQAISPLGAAVFDGAPVPPLEEAPARATQSAKLTCGVGVLVDMVTSESAAEAGANLDWGYFGGNSWGAGSAGG